MAEQDDTEAQDKRRKKTNLVLRTHGAMTGLSPHPSTGDTWIVLTPHPTDQDDWTLRVNPAAPADIPSLKYVFPTEQDAQAAAAKGDRVEGGWWAGKIGSVEVRKVVVHFVGAQQPMEFDGAIYDAVFWSESAKQKFLDSYYAVTTVMSNMSSSAMLAAPIGHQRWSKTGTA